ncbi:MAG TPA: alkaline phytoceramidase [Myxococcota bacterium]|nr:alkaline phytoceramidase [Myxococcota bacterium]
MDRDPRLARGALYLLAFTVLCVAGAFLLPAMPQPIDYHHFADQRAWLGIENFLDVASNVGFLLVGALGLAVTFRRRTCFELDRERAPYSVFFAGMLLTALGSSYYHLAPDNDRLFWDRLPMTIAFMSLIAAQVVERISIRMGLALLLPMLLVGAASVLHWRATERAGAGNVVPYAILQGYSVVALLLIAWLQPSRYTRGGDLYWVFAWYVVAKLLELLDRPMWAVEKVVSGHTLKHLAAAVAGLVVCRMLMLRELRAPRTVGPSRARALA